MTTLAPAPAQVGASPLFEGKHSLRDPYERLAFWATALLALPAALVIGYLLHESIGASQVALFIVVAMVYVTLARGRLLGSSVRVHEAQYPRVFEIVKRVCAALEIPMPLVFVREDNLVPVAALGFGEPYSIVLSSHWIEVFKDDELSFMIGRELGHIAAGHTRFLSLLSVNGNENPIVSLIFGAWLRRCATSCDKVGLLCCGSLDSAIRAMGVAAFHEFARKVDYDVFAEQHAEIESDPISRWGAWLGAEPYATTRIASLRGFIATRSYENARAWFARERDEQPPLLSPPGTVTVAHKDCAGWWRRFAAIAIDLVVVTAIIGSFAATSSGGTSADNDTVAVAPGDVHIAIPGGSVNIEGKHHTSAAKTPLPTTAPSPEPTVFENLGPFTIRGTENSATFSLGPFAWQTKPGGGGGTFLIGGMPVQTFLAPTSTTGRFFWIAAYMTVLVALAGQSFGMMITGLRVVTTDFQRPGIIRTIARYAIAYFLWWLIVPMSFFWHRVLLHDRWTKTRLVKVERVLARATGTN